MKESTKNRLTELIGDRTDDVAIEMLELINDDGVDDDIDWKTKYEENDSEWRQRYTKRFIDGNPIANNTNLETDTEPDSEPSNKLESLTIDSVLFE